MRNFTSGRNHFENSLLGPLYGTLLLNSFANPATRLTTEEYQKLNDFFTDAAATTADVRQLSIMIQISELMARGRRAFASASGSCLQALAVEADELQTSMQVLLVSMRERLRTLEVHKCTVNGNVNVRIYASFQRVYGVALSASAILLCAQRTLQGSSPHDYDYEPDLRSTTLPNLDAIAAELCHAVLQVTHDSQAFRPLGAVWTVHVLICAWCAVKDITLRTMVGNALLDYQRDAKGPNADLRLDQLKLLERRLSLLE